MTRLFVVWCPDWPVVAAGAAAGLPLDAPAAVVAANRVVAVNAAARAEGVGAGMRRRESQGRCPDLAVLPADPDRDARHFERVAAAVERLAPGVEVVRPGVVAVAAKGPAAYFATEAAVAEKLIDQVAAHADAECLVGAADGLFAATLAAQRGLVVPAGRSAEFLSPLGVRELLPEHAELVDLLRRLGLHTLGAFGALPEGAVASRFGVRAVLAHRLARGLEQRPPARRAVPDDLVATHRPDTPVERVDAVAFAARGLAERLHEALAGHGLACTRLAIAATTERGEVLRRVWRCADPLTPAGIADRVRWQLDGWLRGPDRPSAGITELRLEPEEVVDGPALQLGLWQGGQDERALRAGRAMVHVQGLLGPGAVLTPVPSGGRGPAERITLVPWGDERAPAAPPDRPWPGSLPAPSPSVIPPAPVAAEVLADDGRPVGVSGRFALTATPAAVAVAGGPARAVVGWAGPWAADETWWHPPAARRRARLQVLLAPDEHEPAAYLLVREDRKWSVEGMYD
ncbi:DNA polymerase Y family protein [Actinokineospora pegani]|uniref:DNA polymerase Y family protein n=1 Tax=Actinokineospora pegani TaxID=2654637 RepID=UPI0018D4B4BE|nr:DNA polymerase Y family protein [Actinokineospora pegani]